MRELNNGIMLMPSSEIVGLLHNGVYIRALKSIDIDIDFK